MAKPTQQDSIIAAFEAKGWTRPQAVGLAANLSYESNFNHTAVGDNGAAYGIAQWQAPRQRDFKEWSGKDIRQSTLEDQINFVDHELRAGKEASAGKRLLAAKTAAEAGGIVSRYYERPAAADFDADRRSTRAAQWAGEPVGAVAPPMKLEAGTDDWPRLPSPRADRKDAFTEAKAADQAESAQRLATGTVQRQFLQSTTDAQYKVTDDMNAAGAAQVAAGDAITVGDVFSERRTDARGNSLFNLLDIINAPSEPRVPGWYAANKDRLEAGMNDDERAYLRENAKGDDSGNRAIANLMLRRDQDKTYGMAGGFTGFAGQMAADMLDPLAFAAGIGTGKVMSVFGIGSAVLSRAARPGAATAAFLGENALGNMSVEAMQDAMGETKTTADYAMAAAMGIALSAPFARGVHRTAVNEGVRKLADDMHAAAVAEQMKQIGDMKVATGETDPLKLAALVNEKTAADVRQEVADAGKVTTPTDPEALPAILADDQRAAAEAPAGDQAPTVVEQPPAAPAGEPQVKVPEAVDAAAVTDPAVRQPVVEKPAAETVAQVNEAVSNGGEVTRDIPAADGGTVRLSWNLTKETPDAGSFSVKEILDGMGKLRNMDGSTRAMVRYFQKMLSEQVNNVGVKFKKTRAGSSSLGTGVFYSDTNKISLPTDIKGRAPLGSQLEAMSSWHMGTVLHEIGHAATHGKIEAVLQAPDKVSPGLRTAVEGLSDLLGRYQAEVKKRFPSAKDTSIESQANRYAAKDVHEFAAQVWGSPEVRALLRDMEGKPVAGIASSAYRELTGLLSKIMGKGKVVNTGLAEATKRLDMILSADGSNIRYFSGNAPMLQGPANPQGAAVSARKWAQDLYDQAKADMAADPIDRSRLGTLTQKMGVESDGLVLAGSQNPLAQKWAKLVIETTTGAAGRGATAVRRMMGLHKKLIGNTILDYNNSITTWHNERGTKQWDRLVTGDAAREFNREVYFETIRRRDPNFVSQAHPSVVEAANTFEAMFERARKAQIDGATLGSGNLPQHSKGYMPQALDGNKLQNFSVQDLNLLHAELSRQFQHNLGWDAAFSDTFAPYYTDRVRSRAQGMKGVDGIAAGGDSTQIVREALEAMGLDPNVRNQGAAATAAAGLGHTKKRLNLDLTHELRPGLLLADAYNLDVPSLARSYARRTAGTVALAEKNILGIQGIQKYREAMAMPFEDGTRVSKRELDAFDRTASELMGAPVTGSVNSAFASNLSMFVSLQRLGGLVFTQFSEQWNALHHLGLGAALNGIGALPKMYGEVGRLKKGGASGNRILSSIETMFGEIGTEHYKMVMPLDPQDARLGQYMDQSGIITRLIRGGGHLQSKVSFFRGLLAAQHRAQAEQIVMKAARYIRDGGDDVALRDMGFTPDLVKAVKADLPNVAKFGPDGRLAEWDMTKVSDPRVAEAFAQAVDRGTSQIIQGTTIGERSKWAHNDWINLMLQLKTFGINATEKQWSRTVMNQGGGAKGYGYAAGFLVAQTALAVPLHLARVELASVGREDREKYLKDNLAPAAVVKAALNYGSLSGLTSDTLDMLTSIAGGWGDAEQKELLGVRNTSASASIGRIVPAAGTIDNLFKVASGRADLHTSIKQLPFSNLWYLAPIINMTKKE